MPRSFREAIRTAEHISTPSLPSWYYRLLTIRRDRLIEPYDFDEDLSDLEETGGEKGDEDNCSTHGSCKHDTGDSECDCESAGSDTDSDLTERSYDGSDADLYYQLKCDREERKHQLQDITKCQRQEKTARREFEQQQEQEVLEAYERLKKAIREGNMPPKLERLVDKSFNLYSVDHVDHCWEPELYGLKHISFYEEVISGEHKHGSSNNATKIDGQMILSSDCDWELDSFLAPEYASTKAYKLKDSDGEFAIECRFISNDYIMITAPRELVFMEEDQIPSTAGTFKFVGISVDSETERQRRRSKREGAWSPRAEYLKRKKETNPKDRVYETSCFANKRA
ncbi:hypothetical protein FDECE_3939 [Fusarium decemcellulare]|nr:hypothetical protein FDECE_3939 [Fusarium decemcellulare]